MSKDLVWFITGCSTGFGRALAEELLTQGHRVAATARRPETLEGLDPGDPSRFAALRLDVTDTASIPTAVAAAERAFGRIDVLVNNAAYGIVGSLEEVPEPELRRIFETNVFGLLATTRAMLPILRRQRSGWILNFSSVAGISATPGFGIYNATKFAVEGHSEALAQEVAHLGIQVRIIAPGPFRTDFAGRSIVRTEPMADYDASVGAARRYLSMADGHQAGDPARAAKEIIRLVEEGRPGLRVPFGKVTLDRVRAKLEHVRQDMAAGEAAALATDFAG